MVRTRAHTTTSTSFASVSSTPWPAAAAPSGRQHDPDSDGAQAGAHDDPNLDLRRRVLDSAGAASAETSKISIGCELNTHSIFPRCYILSVGAILSSCHVRISNSSLDLWGSHLGSICCDLGLINFFWFRFWSAGRSALMKALLWPLCPAAETVSGTRAAAVPEATSSPALAWD
jgi:hypothetical protein